jgi:hypothetical protein
LASRSPLLTILAILVAAQAVLAAEPARDQAIFFYTPGCRMCGPTKDAVRKAQEKYAGRTSVEWLDMSDPKEGTSRARRLFQLLDRYGVKETPELALFVGSACLAGPEKIIEDVEGAFDRELSGGRNAPAPRPVEVRRTGLWAVTLAALADGFNPCAFATVVLLVSMMATTGRTKREVLIIGLAFVIGVYMTYFLIGLCLYGVLQRLSGFFVVSDCIYLLAFGLCVVFAALSMWDAWIVHRGAEPKEMVLRLPESLKTKMQLYMSRGVRARGALFGAVLLTAAVVSLIEAACTGQVYFPVINGLVREASTRGQGLLLLAWYNLLFVLPLVGVLGLALFGVSSERLARFSRGHLAWMKLGLAAAFVLMAAWMWPGLVWPPGRR